MLFLSPSFPTVCYLKTSIKNQRDGWGREIGGGFRMGVYMGTHG